MPSDHKINWRGLAVILAGAAALVVVGCFHTPLDLSQGPAPLRTPPPDREGKEEECRYEDGLTGGRVFSMYCGYCHNKRPLSERPFSNYKNVDAHMRSVANLSGKEYAELVAWMRRWHDVPPPNPPVEPSPKKLTFSQPLNELREKKPADEKAPKPPAADVKPEAEEAAEEPNQ
jgi:hypothetical protein